jgi:hypothetical protein
MCLPGDLLQRDAQCGVVGEQEVIDGIFDRLTLTQLLPLSLADQLSKHPDLLQVISQLHQELAVSKNPSAAMLDSP